MASFVTLPLQTIRCQFRSKNLYRYMVLSRLHPLAVSSTVLSARVKSSRSIEEEDADDKPIQYTKSAASRWKVDESLGSRKKQPLWKVLLVSGSFVIFLLWASFRKESDIDRLLEKNLQQQWEEMETQKNQNQETKVVEDEENV